MCAAAESKSEGVKLAMSELETAKAANPKLDGPRLDEPKLNEPKLDKPGAGLPFIEWAVAKYIVFPRRFKNSSKEKALADFAEQSDKILKLARGLSSEQLVERRLIARLQGLEDSSRYWSVAMTLDHLTIVGNLMSHAVIELSKGSNALKVVGTAEVKPGAAADAARSLKDFEEMTERFLLEVGKANIDVRSKVTHPHPWFGPLNAYQWLVFAAPHENIHLRQIEAIVALL
ncbi:MAG: hypothetical protein C0508_03995 [Cyanobacteria bacterium PR.023]|nr:hypothetical protein [Cyanobacteria bacterium PR.023]